MKVIIRYLRSITNIFYHRFTIIAVIDRQLMPEQQPSPLADDTAAVQAAPAAGEGSASPSVPVRRGPGRPPGRASRTPAVQAAQAAAEGSAATPVQARRRPGRPPRSTNRTSAGRAAHAAGRRSSRRGPGRPRRDAGGVPDVQDTSPADDELTAPPTPARMPSEAEPVESDLADFQENVPAEPVLHEPAELILAEPVEPVLAEPVVPVPAAPELAEPARPSQAQSVESIPDDLYEPMQPRGGMLMQADADELIQTEGIEVYGLIATIIHYQAHIFYPECRARAV